MNYVDFLEDSFKASLPDAWLSSYKNLLDHGNPHSKKFPLMNPFHVFLVGIAYLVIISVGQIVMKNRKKFELRWFSLLHNGMMVCINGYMCVEIIRQALINDFTLFGNGVDTSAAGLPLAKVLWLFYITKPIEFIDTYIMVLKKNNHQVSFLHVYHHIATFWIWWAVLYFVPGGDTYFSAAQNSFIHVLMYGYYFLASLKINAPWKRYLTQAQMLQFGLNMVQSIYVIYYPTPYPSLFAYILLTYCFSLLVLFGNFYIQSNSKRGTTSPSTSPRTQKKQE